MAYYRKCSKCDAEYLADSDDAVAIQLADHMDLMHPVPDDDALMYEGGCAYCPNKFSSDSKKELSDMIKHHMETYHMDAGFLEQNRTPSAGVSQRVIFHTLDQDDRAIDIPISGVADLLTHYNDDDVTTLQVTLSDDTMLYFNKRNIVVLEVTDLV